MPEKLSFQPEKNLRIKWARNSRIGEKGAKKAGKRGRESQFLSEKKAEMSPKSASRPLLPFLAQKNRLPPLLEAATNITEEKYKDTHSVSTTFLRNNISKFGEWGKAVYYPESYINTQKT